MRNLMLASLMLVGSSALACEQFRWFEGQPGQEDDAQSGIVHVPDGYHGTSCFESSPAQMRHGLSLILHNSLDADYVLNIDDGTGTVFERLIPAGTMGEPAVARLHNAGNVASYRVTMTLTHPTEEAFLTAQISETEIAQIMHVTAEKVADSMRPSPKMDVQVYQEMPLHRVRSDREQHER